MAKFTTRVLLHDADEDDYETLHEAMEGKGFSRTITSDDGIEYHLPPAEYDFQGRKTRPDVLALAKEAAGETGLKFAVLVSEVEGRTWSGLAKVKR